MLFIPLLTCGKSDKIQDKKAIEFEDPFEVILYDSDYSLAQSTVYQLTMDSIKVTNSSGIVDERAKVAFEKQLSESEQVLVWDFFQNFPFEDLATAYINPKIDDGDQKLFKFKIGKNQREIQVSNLYQKDLAALVELFNTIVPIDQKIEYLAN